MIADASERGKNGEGAVAFVLLLPCSLSSIFSAGEIENELAERSTERRTRLSQKNATQTLVVLAKAKKKPGNVPSASLDLLGLLLSEQESNPARRRILTSIVITDAGENPTSISS